MSSRSPRPTWLIPVGVVALVTILLLVSVIDRGTDAEIDEPTTAEAAQTVDEWPARRIDGDPYALGALDAPVVLVEYADFQCGFCGRWHRETLPILQERYIEPGLVRFEWRDLPFLGDDSYIAAFAGRAAGRQGQFWEFYDAVYSVERKSNTGELNHDGVVSIATELGLDIDQFNIDREHEVIRDEVLTNLGEANAIGFSSTPSFVVNKRAIVGAQPLEVFIQVLDEALREVGATPPS